MAKQDKPMPNALKDNKHRRPHLSARKIAGKVAKKLTATVRGL
eukprot:CAMPEP_0169319444 /NCGR_PEP_ID=MMETSP1017-20121227/7833_1 /TAXON_ID=342587 /ORGANISM="Karlodinium micrum, Strain CCMP2283" /LENGTH=42 /DNA_ID= /DNA_START= /DNA_END= /DNA_ORIENTATION=